MMRLKLPASRSLRWYLTPVLDVDFNNLILFKILKQEQVVPKTEFPELLVQDSRISIKHELTVLIWAKSEFRILDLVN